MKNFIKQFLIIFFTLFLGIASSSADNSYKNELTKVGLSPLGVNDVKVTLYTSKPYAEPLRLLKKNDSEYVLILPETYSSAPQKPSISDVVGEVTDVDVKLYSFVTNSSQNGYTKIVIKTNGSTNLYTEAVSNGKSSVKTPSQEVNKIVASQIKQQAPKTETQANKIEKKPVEQENKKVETKKATAEKKDKGLLSLLQPKNEAQKQETKKQEQLKKEVEQTPKQEEPKQKEEIIDYTPITATIPQESIVSNEIVDTEPNFIDKTLHAIKIHIVKIQQKINAKNENQKHNNFYNFPIIIIAIIAALLTAKKMITQSKKQPDYVSFDEESKPQYSTFFKTLVNAEQNGNNPFMLAQPQATQEPQEIQETQQEINTPKETQTEVMNADQNLTWQEKFRAVQKNKKSLLKEDNPENQIEVDKTIKVENPIKKLKQDFRAVKKVLSKQRAKQEGNKEAVEAFDKIDTVEVISFDDYQKMIEPPKVQIHKTMPLKTVKPKILSQLQLAQNKGLYLVDYKEKIALVGYIGNKIFKLRTYNTLRNSKIYARLSEKLENKETYIVKFDNNKILVDVSDEQIKLKLQY